MVSLMCSILKYGGAVVAEEISTDATHIFYDSFHAATVMSNKSSSCLCFDVRFIGNYLFGCGVGWLNLGVFVFNFKM